MYILITIKSFIIVLSILIKRYLLKIGLGILIFFISDFIFWNFKKKSIYQKIKKIIKNL